MLDYTVTTDVTGEIRVAFTNDAGDRDVQVDYIIANGITYQAEDQRVNTGFHDGTSCGSGGYSEMLHCNGYISFGNPFDDEPLQCSISERSEEHTSELQSRGHLVCRLLLEKKKTHK